MSIYHAGNAVKPFMVYGDTVPSNMVSENELRLRFIDLRNRLRLSQEELARYLGVKQPQVGKWESEGVGTPIPRKHLAALADLAGEPMAYFDGITDVVRVTRRDQLIVAFWLEKLGADLRARVLNGAKADGGHQDVALGGEVDHLEDDLHPDRGPQNPIQAEDGKRKRRSGPPRRRRGP